MECISQSPSDQLRGTMVPSVVKEFIFRPKMVVAVNISPLNHPDSHVCPEARFYARHVQRAPHSSAQQLRARTASLGTPWTICTSCRLVRRGIVRAAQLRGRSPRPAPRPPRPGGPARGPRRRSLTARRPRECCSCTPWPVHRATRSVRAKARRPPVHCRFLSLHDRPGGRPQKGSKSAKSGVREVGGAGASRTALHSTSSAAQHPPVAWR